MSTTTSASIFLGGQWFLPAVVLSMICFVAQPLLMHKDMNLELKRTLEPRVMSREGLAKTGTVPRQEIIVAIGFMFASVGRASAFSQASTPTRSVSASLPSLRQAP